MHFLAQIFQFLIFARVDRVRILDGIEIRVAGGEKKQSAFVILKSRHAVKNRVSHRGNTVPAPDEEASLFSMTKLTLIAAPP